MAYQICQHIIGMNPTTLKGSLNANIEIIKTDESFNQESTNESVNLENELNAFTKVEVSKFIKKNLLYISSFSQQ